MNAAIALFTVSETVVYLAEVEITAASTAVVALLTIF